jgi:hypothetical protein
MSLCPQYKCKAGFPVCVSCVLCKGTSPSSHMGPSTGSENPFRSGPGGGHPESLAYDGTNLWVTDHNSSYVIKLDARDGSIQGTYGIHVDPGPGSL